MIDQSEIALEIKEGTPTQVRWIHLMSHNVVTTSLLWEFPMCANIINRFLKMLNKKGKVVFQSPIDMTVSILSTSNIKMQNPVIQLFSVIHLCTQ